MLVGSEYWRELLGWMKHSMRDSGCISPEDLDLLRVADEPQEILEAALAPASPESKNPRRRTRRPAKRM